MVPVKTIPYYIKKSFRKGAFFCGELRKTENKICGERKKYENNKGHNLFGMWPLLGLFVGLFAQTFDMLCQLRLEVGRLVLVDDVGLSQFVQHFLHCGIHFNCFLLVRHSAKLANSITHCLGVVPVVQGSRLRLTDSFH